METKDTEEKNSLNKDYNFLYKSGAKQVFGKVDFMLKSGTHIQYQHPDQEEEYEFINRNFNNGLVEYYQDFFSLWLEKGGTETQSYYYLDFHGSKREPTPLDQRHFLSEECLVIGIFICKVYNIDFNSEESSITSFIKLMKEEYEEYKDDFYRLLASTKKNKYTKDDSEQLSKIIKDAFKEFARLGWVYFKNDEQFIIQPSIERLRKLYSGEINNTKKLAESYNQKV